MWSEWLDGMSDFPPGPLEELPYPGRNIWGTSEPMGVFLHLRFDGPTMMRRSTLGRQYPASQWKHFQNNIYTKISARLAELNVHYTGQQVRRIRKDQQMVQHHSGNDSPHLSGTLAQSGNTNNTGSILRALVEKFRELKVSNVSKAAFSFIIHLYTTYKITNERNSPRRKLITTQVRVQIMTGQNRYIISGPESSQRGEWSQNCFWTDSFINKSYIQSGTNFLWCSINDSRHGLCLRLSLRDMSATGKVN